jgi:hypothetical protein
MKNPKMAEPKNDTSTSPHAFLCWFSRGASLKILIPGGQITRIVAAADNRPQAAATGLRTSEGIKLAGQVKYGKAARIWQPISIAAAVRSILMVGGDENMFARL